MCSVCVLNVTIWINRERGKGKGDKVLSHNFSRFICHVWYPTSCLFTSFIFAAYNLLWSVTVLWLSENWAYYKISFLKSRLNPSGAKWWSPVGSMLLFEIVWSQACKALWSPREQLIVFLMQNLIATHALSLISWLQHCFSYPLFPSLFIDLNCVFS